MVARRTQPPLTSSGDETSGGAGDKGITPHRKPKDKRQTRERALQVRPPRASRSGCTTREVQLHLLGGAAEGRAAQGPAGWSVRPLRRDRPLPSLLSPS